MLLTIVEIVSCENPKCRDFARISPNPHRLKTYYCPVCSKVSALRVVDANIAESPERYKTYLLERSDFADELSAERVSGNAFARLQTG